MTDRKVNTGIFSEEALSDLVERTVPKDRTFALVLSVDEDNFVVAVEMKKDTKIGEWKASAGYTRDWSGDNKVGAKIVWSI
jgi:hypothetical protein